MYITSSFASRIRGTTAVEISSGLHWYLKYWCAAHISWDKTGGAQLGSVPQPGSLPRVVGEGVKVERPVPWNYYQNVVTSSCTCSVIFPSYLSLFTEENMSHHSLLIVNKSKISSTYL